MQKDMFIHHHQRNGFYTMQKYHFHEQYEIYYLISGERTYFIKDLTYRIREGDLVFIDKYELHKTGDTRLPNHERVLINFADGFLGHFNQPLLFEPFRMKIRLLTVPPQDRVWVQALLFEMLKEANDALPGSDTALQAQLASLLIWCARRLNRGSGTDFEHESPAHKKIADIVADINGSFSEPLSLESIAKQHYISPYHLSRMFKRVTGFSFVEYVNSIRINEAQRLLRETDWKVTLIAERVGYENIGHFGRVFKEIAKTNPLDYRKTAKRVGQ
ncbi:AraC family transcriptional regulator [Paenibacillus ferrarius]|uniref:helix-turn-helix transcriptional regulator n=1 Tax=Paenibacillus ferrarius TaxID=1469647 RepID=UPI003D2E27B5